MNRSLKKRIEKRVEKLEKALAPNYAIKYNIWNAKRDAEHEALQAGFNAWILGGDRETIRQAKPPIFIEDYAKDENGVVYQRGVLGGLYSLTLSKPPQGRILNEPPTEEEVREALIAWEVEVLEKYGDVVRHVVIMSAYGYTSLETEAMTVEEMLRIFREEEPKVQAGLEDVGDFEAHESKNRYT